MAKQKGIIKIKGTIGDMTFYKSADGYIVKEKSEVPKDKILNDPAFVRTRENMSEFSRAGKASKMLRTSVRTLIQNAKDRLLTSRLTKEWMRVIKLDATSTRGQRNVIDGETELLKEFNFNINSILSTTFYAPYTKVIDRVLGKINLDILAFNAGSMIVPPAGATHFKIVSAGSEIDFEMKWFNTAEYESGFIALDTAAVPAINIEHTLTANSTHPLFLLLGVQFYQDVNGEKYSLKNGAFNALSIVDVEGV